VPEEVVECGAENYDPFNPPNSACCGTMKLSEYLNKAETFLKINRGQLEACKEQGAMVATEFGWARYYLGALGYNGAPIDKLADFKKQRDDPEACKGTYVHYIEYLNSVISNTYAQDATSFFLSAVGACQSECPGKES
jgi:hypothetical protein